MDKLSKLDPSNVELMSQKQKILTDSIEETSKKLKLLKDTQKQVEAQFKNGDIGEDQYRAFQREVVSTEEELKDLNAELESCKNGFKDHADEVDKSKEKLSEFKDKAKDVASNVGKGITAIGTATVAGAGYAVKLSTEYDQAFNTLITKTGASKDEFDALDEAMTNVYANNFGESMEDVAESMATVKTNTKLTGDELQNATERAILLRDTFGFEVNESTRTAKMLMDQYGVSAEQAFNLIAQGAQNGLDKNGDLLDTINEYSVHFKQLGFDSEEMFNMLVSGAENGTFSVDKLGDAIKEFGIRAKDGSDSSRAAFEYLGYDADKLFKIFNEGGEEAAAMTQIILDELASMPDGVEKTTAGVALFGTMWEDLGAKGIQALSELDGGVSLTKDVLEEINNQKYDDIGSALQGLKRTLETEVIEPVGEELKPVVQDAIGYVQENAPQIKDIISNLVSKIGDFVGFIVNNKDALITTISAIGTGLLVWNVASMINGVVGAIKAYKTANELASTSQAIFNAVLNANPLMLIVTIVAAVIAAIVAFIATNDEARAKISEIWGKIKETFSNVIGAVVNFFTVTIPEAFNTFKETLITKVAAAFNSVKAFFTQTVPETIDNVVTWFKSLPGKIWTAILGTVDKIAQWGANVKAKATEVVSNAIDAIVKFFSDLPYKIGYAIGFVIGKLITWKDNIINWVTTQLPIIINNIISYFKALPSKIYNAIVNTIDRVKEWGSDVKTAAINKISETVTNVVTKAKELPGKIKNAIQSAISRVKEWGSNVATAAKDKITDMVNKVVTTAKTLPSKIYNAIKNAITKVGEWCNSMKSKAVTGIKNVVTAITDGFKSLPEKVKTIGKNIVEGIWNGIKNATAWIKEKVGEFAKGILDGMKESLGIHSPSRVFRDQVGKYIAQGVGAGITENEDAPITALETMGEDMVNSARNINGITLRRQMETTFNGTVSSDIGIINRLDAIVKKLEARTQIVLDTGVLVGETVDAMDTALGNKKTQLARGW